MRKTWDCMAKSWMYEVVINGAAKEIGKAAAVAVTKARGMEVAGAVDSVLIGQDAGKIIDELISLNHNEFKGEPEALAGEWQLLWSSQAGCRHLELELGSHDLFGSFPL